MLLDLWSDVLATLSYKYAPFRQRPERRITRHYRHIIQLERTIRVRDKMSDLKEVKSSTSHPRHSHQLSVGHVNVDLRKPSVTTVLPEGDVPDFEGLSADEAALVALGYKQEFKREFSLWTTFCVSFAVLGLLPSFASTLYYGMGYAGTGGMVWGWLISWVFIQCVAMGMAELCSSMPTRYVKCEPDPPPVQQLTFLVAVDFTTLLLFWHLPDGVHSPHG